MLSCGPCAIKVPCRHFRMVDDKITIYLRSALADLALSCGWVESRIQKFRNSCLILGYHRILPHAEAIGRVEPGMYVDPAAFEIHLKFLRKYFVILPLTAFDPAVSCRACFLTFDDGWHDFYLHAFPILAAYNIPATVFLPTDYIGTNRWFWTDRLAWLWRRRSRSENFGKTKNYLINALERLRGLQTAQIGAAIEMLKQYPEIEIESLLEELAVRWQVHFHANSRVYMSWEEVREMGKSSLIAYGSHGASHRILTTLSQDNVEEELSRSKRRLISEGVAEYGSIPFCYPNGGYNSRIAMLVKTAGYSLAVTTRMGWAKSGVDVCELPRVSVHQDISSTEALFGLRIAAA